MYPDADITRSIAASAMREKPDRIREVAAEVEALGLKVHAQYALMGQYDFLNILEAPDEETMAKAAIMLASRGTAPKRAFSAS